MRRTRSFGHCGPYSDVRIAPTLGQRVHRPEAMPRYNEEMRLRASKTLVLEPPLPAPLAPLRDLAFNLYWTWNTDAASLFERLDRQLWRDTGHNPVATLQRAPADTLERFAADEGFLAHLNRVSASFKIYLEREPLLTLDAISAPEPIAYFSLE